MLHNKVHRAIKHLEYFKFVVNKEQTKSAKELSKYLNENFGFRNFKEMIMKAVDLGKGHWFKCKNGHFYTIGECGGAMQTSKCPDCGEVIGG